MPEFNVNLTAVLLVVVVNFIFSIIWYAPLFGKAWREEMGVEHRDRPPLSVAMTGFLSMIVGNFLFAFVLANNMAAYNPVTWGHEPLPYPAAVFALLAAFFTWLGFYLPLDIRTVTWERKSWRLFSINTGYRFFSLLIAALILAYM